jgi:hypothetical protein
MVSLPMVVGCGVWRLMGRSICCMVGKVRAIPTAAGAIRTLLFGLWVWRGEDSGLRCGGLEVRVH